MADREMPHVYQNRRGGYDPYNMRYCPTCNGYYGVPHEGSCNVVGGCRIDARQCACRFHVERRGGDRQGRFGWICGRGGV